MRKTSHLERHRQNKEVSLLTLHLIGLCKCEELQENRYQIHQKNSDTSIVFLAELKRKLKPYPSSSIDNRCLPNVHFCKVKNRFPRRERILKYEYVH